MVELCAVEDSVMAKVVLQPACLCLCRGDEDGGSQPGGPRVATVPQEQNGSNVEQNNVREVCNEEPRVGFEQSLN